MVAPLARMTKSLFLSGGRPQSARARILVAVPNPAIADLFRQENRLDDGAAQRVGCGVVDGAQLAVRHLVAGRRSGQPEDGVAVTNAVNRLDRPCQAVVGD